MKKRPWMKPDENRWRYVSGQGKKMSLTRWKNSVFDNNGGRFEAMAPVFFILSAGLRCFLETSTFAAFDDFSYYTLLHHVLWYVTAISAVMLFLSLYLKVTPKRLFWLYYGGAIIFIPVLYSALTHTPMRLEYFTGSLSDIIRYSLTAGWAFERNRPQFFAILTLDIGIFITGYYYSQSVKKAFITLIGCHLILTLVGTKWFSDQNGPESLVFIRTDFPGHGFMALIWLQTASFLTVGLIVREKKELFSEKGVDPNLFWIGLIAWMTMAGLFYALGLLHTGFDAVTGTSPAWTAVLLIGVIKKRGDLFLSPRLIAIIVAMLLIQLMVTAPLSFPGHPLSPRKIVVPIFY